MNNMLGAAFGPGWNVGFPLIGASFLLVAVLWSVFWKGLALWHSARRGEPWWFLALLLLNTVGILEIIYLFAICKLRFGELFGGAHPSHTSHGHNGHSGHDHPHTHAHSGSHEGHSHS